MPLTSQQIKVLEARKEVARQNALECYNTLKARGVKVCAFCHLDVYCPMSKDATDFLSDLLLKVDPHNNISKVYLG